MSNTFGSPCDLYREQILLNASSYSSSAAADSDDFRFNAITEATPARTTHTHDNTAYSTQPTLDNWAARLHGNGPSNAVAPVQT